MCSRTIVLAVRLYIRNRANRPAVDIVNLIFISTVLISIEDTLIFTVLYTLAIYNEDSPSGRMYFVLVQSGIPVFISVLAHANPRNYP